MADLHTNARGGKGVHIAPYVAQEHPAVPFFISRIPAGFPSPAADYSDDGLDLNDLVIRHPAATFFVRVEGESMLGAGIHPGDTLVVDRAWSSCGSIGGCGCAQRRVYG